MDYNFKKLDDYVILNVHLIGTIRLATSSNGQINYGNYFKEDLPDVSDYELKKLWPHRTSAIKHGKKVSALYLELELVKRGYRLVEISSKKTRWVKKRPVEKPAE